MGIMSSLDIFIIKRYTKTKVIATQRSLADYPRAKDLTVLVTNVTIISESYKYHFRYEFESKSFLGKSVPHKRQYFNVTQFQKKVHTSSVYDHGSLFPRSICQLTHLPFLSQTGTHANR